MGEDKKQEKEKWVKEKRDKEKREKEKSDKRGKEKQEKRDKKQQQMRPKQGTVELGDLLDRTTSSSSSSDDETSKKKQKEKQKQKDQKKLDKQQQREELNVMGYVTGENMNPMSAGDKGYKFVDGESRQGGVNVYVDDDERRGRRHLRRPRPDGEKR